MKAIKELFIITGGTRGIGKAIALAALKLKTVEVIIVSRQEEKVASKNLPGVKHMQADLTSAHSVDKLIKGLLKLKTPVRTLINNAGSILDTSSLNQVKREVLQQSMELHCISPLLLSNALVSQLELSSNPSIINIGSIYGNIADVDVPTYTLSKSTMPILTTLMAKSYAPKIRVNCILPGHVDTDMTKSAPQDFINDIINKTPLARVAAPSEIANTAMFLSSTDASFINGAIVRVDGGFWSTIP